MDKLPKVDRAMEAISDLAEYLQERGKQNLETSPAMAIGDLVEAKRLYDLAMKLDTLHAYGHFEDKDYE